MKRIKTITDMIAYGDIADIGTGDGLISIHALETGKAKKSIACDLNAGPLEVAKRNAAIRGYGCGGNNEIEFRLAFGLDLLRPGEVNTAIIAGMGGQTIVGIISQAEHVLAETSGCDPNGVNNPQIIDQLILQPQSDYREVRKSVHRLNFCIVNEVMIMERGKYYLIMDCRKGVDVCYSESDYLLGRFLPESGDKVFYEYLKREISLMENIISKAGGIDRITARLEEIERDCCFMRSCLPK